MDTLVSTATRFVTVKGIVMNVTLCMETVLHCVCLDG